MKTTRKVIFETYGSILLLNRGTPNPRTKTANEIVLRWAQGDTQRDIARVVKKSLSTVSKTIHGFLNHVKEHATEASPPELLITALAKLSRPVSRGRKARIDEQLRNRLLGLARLGFSKREAAAALKLHPSTLYRQVAHDLELNQAFASPQNLT